VGANVWPSIAVVGAGAVGCYFGGMLARAGAPVTLIGRAHHVEAIQRNGLFLDSVAFHEHIAVAATTEPSAVKDAELVLVCVKTLDTEEVARSLATYLRRGFPVISLQNGVDNTQRMRSAANIDVIPAVIYVAVAMAGPGHVRHSGRGEIVVGALSNSTEPQHDLAGIVALFARAGVPCRISENIDAELWTKLIINCACNAISALTHARYGAIVRHPQARGVMSTVVREGVAVAGAAGIQLAAEELIERCWRLGEAMSEATSSTAQDVARGKRTEIDSLNGFVARRGAELGVPTPVNETLHALVKLLEESSVNAS
jgi:2-dehydropantoate 2-reductase